MNKPVNRIIILSQASNKITIIILIIIIILPLN